MSNYDSWPELTGLEEHLEHEAGAYGDPRRCPRHPHIATSSPDGMFDAPCGACENAEWLEMYGEAELTEEAREERAAKLATDHKAWLERCANENDKDIPF